MNLCLVRASSTNVDCCAISYIWKVFTTLLPIMTMKITKNCGTAEYFDKIHNNGNSENR